MVKRHVQVRIYLDFTFIYYSEFSYEDIQVKVSLIKVNIPDLFMNIVFDIGQLVIIIFIIIELLELLINLLLGILFKFTTVAIRARA